MDPSPDHDEGVLRVEKQEALLALASHRKAIGATDDCCVMCLLAQGKAKPDPVWETESAVVLLDRFGSRRGHLLVISKQHVDDLTDLELDEYLEFQRLAHEAARALVLTLRPARIFVASLGAPKAVPMSFPHFHLHVIPLFETDERCRPARVFSWTDGIVLYDDDAATRLADQIRRNFPRGGGCCAPQSEDLPRRGPMDRRSA